MKVNIGVLVNFHAGVDVAAEIAKVRALELDSFQLCIWEPELYTAENAAAVRAACADEGVSLSALWAGWTGPKVWDFYDGPITLGLVPPAYREQRLGELFAASDFALRLGVSDVATHVGFLPENPNDPDFRGTVAVLRSLCSHMRQRGQFFLFETGQETPATLLRAITEIGTGNVGVNLDTANLILYGKSTTADAVDLLGPYVRNLHCKDGLFPTDARTLGREVPLGRGRADMPTVMRKLRDFGYDGAYTIEREISGSEQIRDVIGARDLIRRIAAAL